MIATILTGKKPIVSVERSTKIAEIVAILHEHRIGAVVVVDADGIHGLVSERDICAGLHSHGPAVLDATAADIMHVPGAITSVHMTVAQAMSTMTDRRSRHLPVIVDGKIVGLVSLGDLVKARIAEAESEAQAMKAYIAS